MEVCANNPEKSSTAKIGARLPGGCSILTIWYRKKENKHNADRGENFMNKFC